MASDNVEKVEILIQSRKFTISCKAGESDSYVKAARLANEQIGEMQNLTGNRLPLDQVLSLVAVNHCRELACQKKDYEKQLGELKEQLKILAEKLDAVGADFA